MKLVPIALALAAALLAGHGALGADETPIIYECPDAEGNIVYQDDPCPAAPPPAARPKAAVKPKEKVAKSKAAAKPTVAAKPTAAKSKESAKPAAAKSKPAPESTQPTFPWTAILPAAPPLAQHVLADPKVDARWTSPQRALQTFVGAVKAGDRALVLSCLTASALADLGPDLEELPLQDLRATVGSFTGYVVEGDLGPYWSVRALRDGTRPKWIFLERTGFGEWKIGAF